MIKVLIAMFLGGNVLWWLFYEVWVLAFISLMLLMIVEYIFMMQEELHQNTPSRRK